MNINLLIIQAYRRDSVQNRKWQFCRTEITANRLGQVRLIRELFFAIAEQLLA